MARTASYERLAALRGAIERDFYKDALCRNAEGVPRIAWTVDRRQATYNIGGIKYSTRTLIDLALRTCQICPVQWECASAAIQSDEAIGIWGDTIENLRSLLRRYPDDFNTVLMHAKEQEITVQVTVRSRGPRRA